MGVDFASPGGSPAATLVAMQSIHARELRNEYARVLREVEAGESFTITNQGRPVAQIAPVPVGGAGPRDSVPFGEIAGALDYLGPAKADELRQQMDEMFDTELEDPFRRATAQRAEIAARQRHQ